MKTICEKRLFARSELSESLFTKAHLRVKGLYATKRRWRPRSLAVR
jgi:hypothetical protein